MSQEQRSKDYGAKQSPLQKSMERNHSHLDTELRSTQWPSLRSQGSRVKHDSYPHRNKVDTNKERFYSSLPNHDAQSVHMVPRSPNEWKNKTEAKCHSQEEESGWVTVTKRSSRKINVEPDSPKVIPMLPNKEERKMEEKNGMQKRNEAGDEKSSEGENEAKKKLHEIRKQRIKDEKMRKREQKAKEMRENLRRDTKVRFINQDTINSLFKSNNQPNSPNLSQNYNSPSVSTNISMHEYPALSRNISLHDYPTLSGNKAPFRNKYDPQKPLIKTGNQSQTKAEVAAPSVNNSLKHIASTKGKSVPAPNGDRGSAWNSLTAPKQALPSERSKARGILLTRENVLAESPNKKKVKSKDLINLEIMDLIELKRKEVVKSKEVPLVVPKAEKKGKISEGKAKRISTLRKNILRQKQVQTELLKGILEDEKGRTTDRLSPATPPKEATERGEKDSPGDDQLPQAKEEGRNDSPLNPEGKEGVPAPERKEGVPTPEEKEGVPAPERNEGVPAPEDRVSPGAHEDLLKELKNLMNPIHSNKFREYCHHVVTAEIDEALKELLESLVMFQERLYHQDPIKGRIKRRYFCGLKEALKHLHRASCLVLAPNLKPSPGKGCVDELVSKVVSGAAEAGVPVVFGLTHRKLGSLCHRKVPVSCVTVLNVQGAQDKFQRLLDLIPEAERQYRDLQAKWGGSNPPWRGGDDAPAGEASGEEKENGGSSVTDSLLEALKL